jgi:rod shape-determining protein MreC
LRENPLGELKVPLTWTAAVALIVALVAVVAILVSDRRDALRATAYGATRGVADRVIAPVGDALAAPGRWTGAGVDVIRGYFFAVSENRRLKAEMKEMSQWRDVALALRNENDRYRTLLGLKTDPPIPMVAARIVTDSRGPFADTRLANTGSDKGVKEGNPVMSENGLVGRIIGVSAGASRVLLVTDSASKIPVMDLRTNARAILTGDGGPNPKLEYLRGQDPVREGDRITTSGDGGVIPRGLPVGTAVKGLDGRWRVVLASDKAPIDFVRILLFQDFTQLADQKRLAERQTPPPTAGALTIGTTPGGAAMLAGAAGAQAKTSATTPGASPTAAKTPAEKPPAKTASDQTAAKPPADKGAAKKPETKPSADKSTADKAGADKSAKPAAAKPAAAKTSPDKAAAKSPTSTAKTPSKTPAKADASKPSSPKPAAAGAAPADAKPKPKPKTDDEEPPT